MPQIVAHVPQIVAHVPHFLPHVPHFQVFVSGTDLFIVITCITFIHEYQQTFRMQIPFEYSL